MKKMLFITAAAAGAALFAKPVAEWDFEKVIPGKSVSFSADKKYRLGDGKIVSGFKGNGLLVNKVWPRTAFPAAQNWKNFTVELKFKLNEDVNKRTGNTLFCYAKNSWNRGQFALQITPKKQLEARFTQVARKQELVLKSEQLDIKPGVFYTVRVASSDGGMMKIFLDGEVVAIREKDSWGFNRLSTPKIPQGYPLMILGGNLATMKQTYRTLNGVIDDVKIWNSFKEPDMTSAVNAGSSLLVAEGKKSVTGKFLVLDKPTQFLGSFVRPDQKFFDAAAHAELELNKNDLIVRIVSPIPAGMKPDTRKNRTWSGDVVEFFFRPDPDNQEYFQYAANASGWSTALAVNYRDRNKAFKSTSKISVDVKPGCWTATFVIPRSEIRLTGDINGKTVTANFTRCGNTAGGQSTWSPVGNNWHAITKFRNIVFGSYQQALLQKLEKSKKEFAAIQGKKELRKAIASELEKLENEIKTNGNKSEFFEGLSQSIARMSLRYTQLRFSGTPNLLWQVPLPWGNDVQVSPLSKPLEKISLVLPQNSFVYTSFVFSNLTQKPFLGQIKIFPVKRLQKKQVYNDFNSKFYEVRNGIVCYPESKLYPNVQFFEALPLVSGDTIHDPLLPLQMGTLLRAGANESKQIWLKFSTKGMKPGKQEFVIVLKPSYPGFKNIEVALNIDVRKIDLGTVKVDATNYTNIYRNGTHQNLVKALVDKENNIIYPGGALGQASMDIYPKIDKQGNVLKYSDYALIDKFIDRTVKAGMPLERIKLVCWLELQSYGLNYRGKRQVPFNSPAWNKGFKAFLEHFTAHLKKKYNITRDRIIFYTVDEPDGDINKKGTRMYYAHLAGKIIKSAGKDFVTMVNPHPNYLRGKDFTAVKKLAEFYDIFEFYRPGLGPEQLKAAKSLKKETWTYSIHGKNTSPEVYRRNYWTNFRDGFTAVSAYWHHENHAGGDGFNSDDGVRNRVDYGNTYLDMEMGTYLSSKREEANMLGKEDYKLAQFCRRMLAKSPSPALKKQLDQIVSNAAAGDMKAMEEARLKLLDLAEKLSK
ncbi:MAG: hypothetical protein E7044_06095 [Lentisphaerae bacterium]|nr:hypothetical protein [Lentisphaerota bacterium]